MQTYILHGTDIYSEINYIFERNPFIFLYLRYGKLEFMTSTECYTKDLVEMDLKTRETIRQFNEMVNELLNH